MRRYRLPSSLIPIRLLQFKTHHLYRLSLCKHHPHPFLLLNRFNGQVVLHLSHQSSQFCDPPQVVPRLFHLLSPFSKLRPSHHRSSRRAVLKRSSAINVERVAVQGNGSVANAAHSCPSTLSWLIFHKQLIGSNDPLHLLMIAAAIR